MIGWYNNFRIAQSENPDDDLLKELNQPLWIPVDSSFVKSIAYYDLAKILEVQLEDRHYTFVNVPKKVYEAFLQAPSKGSFFNEVIRKRYTSQ